MAFNGVRTTDLPVLASLDGVLGNHEGSTGVLGIDALLALINSRTGPAYETIAELFADLDWAAGTLATVWGEATDALNGVYQKSGAFGAGAWTRIGGLPLTPLAQALLDDKADNADLADLETRVTTEVDDLEVQVQAMAAGLYPAGEWDASSGSYPSGANAGDFYVVNTAGTISGRTFAIGDWLIARINAPSTSIFSGNWTRADYSVFFTSALIDPEQLSVGPRADTDPRINSLYVAAQGNIVSGNLNYGLTIQSFEPGIALVDRLSGSGQALISSDSAEIRLRHDPVNNDGTIGSSGNTDTVRSAIFGPSVQRMFVDDVEQLTLDANGLRLGGEQVATRKLVKTFPRVVVQDANNVSDGRLTTGDFPALQVDFGTVQPGDYLITTSFDSFTDAFFAYQQGDDYQVDFDVGLDGTLIYQDYQLLPDRKTLIYSDGTRSATSVRQILVNVATAGTLKMGRRVRKSGGSGVWEVLESYVTLERVDT